MRKTAILTILSLILFATGAFAAENELVFEPVGGGKFIYCNNPEEIVRHDLADDGENPSYLMNNQGLTPDNYSLLISHFNRVTKDLDEERYPGENIWVDGVFTAKSDCKIRITNTAFEIPANNTYYLDYETIQTEDSWSSLFGEATLLKKTIKTADESRSFAPTEFKSREFTVKRGERVFLSEFIENYAPVPYPKHVFIGAEFTVVSGKCDFNIFAAKNRSVQNGVISYPKLDFENCGYGVYKRDRTYKGIADSLPEKQVSLEYTVDDSVGNNYYLPVTVKNRYFPKGVKQIYWTVNINPEEDSFNRNQTAESDLMSFKYKDPSKLEYYGKNVTKKDDVWEFDAYHSDTTGYDGEITGYSADDYLPNYPLDASRDNSGYACNLGNYGIRLKYNLKITNNGTKKRYFNYVVTTAANVICEYGKTAYAKGMLSEAAEDTMATVELPPGKTTEFSVSMTLPVQNYGGQKQSFVITDAKKTRNISQNTMIKPIIEKNAPKAQIDLSKADKKTKAVFEGNTDDYQAVKTDDGYVAANMVISANPYYYGYYWDITGKIFLMDDNFNIKDTLYLGSQPIEMTSCGGKAYIKTIANGSFCIDGGKATEIDGYVLPREVGDNVVSSEKGKLTVNGYPVSFEGGAPSFVKTNGKIFYFATGKKAGVSADGINWTIKEFDKEIKDFSVKNNSVSADGTEISPKKAMKKKILLNGEILSFDGNLSESGGETLIPLRSILERLGMKIISSGGKVFAVSDDVLCEFTPNSRTVIINGNAVTAKAFIKVYNEEDGRLLMPVSLLSSIVSASDNGDFAEITRNITKFLPDIELSGHLDNKPVKQKVKNEDKKQSDNEKKEKDTKQDSEEKNDKKKENAKEPQKGTVKKDTLIGE